MQERFDWYVRLGIDPEHLRLRAHDADELSHYSSATSDVEYLFPYGWGELEGIANRGDFDLSAHARASGEKLEYVDPQGGERFIPHVIEPAAGVGRSMLAFMLDAYDEDELGGERRTVLRLHPALAPVKVAVLPLLRKDGHPELARAVYEDLRRHVKRRVRRGRRDRPALSPPGRDRHPVRDHDRPPVARGRHGHAARPRHARAGARAGRRARAGAARPPRPSRLTSRRVVLLTWRPQPPTSSPMPISTSAGSVAAGRPRRSSSARTGGSGRRPSRRSSAVPRSGTTRCSSGARTRSRPTCRRSSTPRRTRSRSTSSPPSRPTRRAMPSSSSASCARSPASATARWRAGWRRSGRSSPGAS